MSDEQQQQQNVGIRIDARVIVGVIAFLLGNGTGIGGFAGLGGGKHEPGIVATLKADVEAIRKDVTDLKERQCGK